MKPLYGQFDNISDVALWIDALWEVMGEEWDKNGDSEEYDELKSWRDDLVAEMSDVLDVE